MSTEVELKDKDADAEDELADDSDEPMARIDKFRFEQFMFDLAILCTQLARWSEEKPSGISEIPAPPRQGAKGDSRHAGAAVGACGADPGLEDL